MEHSECSINFFFFFLPSPQYGQSNWQLCIHGLVLSNVMQQFGQDEEHNGSGDGLWWPPALIFLIWVLLMWSAEGHPGVCSCDVITHIHTRGLFFIFRHDFYAFFTACYLFPQFRPHTARDRRTLQSDTVDVLDGLASYHLCNMLISPTYI